MKKYSGHSVHGDRPDMILWHKPQGPELHPYTRPAVLIISDAQEPPKVFTEGEVRAMLAEIMRLQSKLDAVHLVDTCVDFRKVAGRCGITDEHCRCAFDGGNAVLGHVFHS